jgi:hypothetical protein
MTIEDFSVSIISSFEVSDIGRKELFKKAVSEIMIIFLSMGMLSLALNIQPAKASGTIYIRADGSIDQPEAPFVSKLIHY